jgi:hypothetical protein
MPARKSSEKCRETQARRVGRLLAQEQTLLEKAARIRAALDRALVHARRLGVPHKQHAYHALCARGIDASAEELLRFADALRTRSAVAAKRCASASHTQHVARRNQRRNDGPMSNTPFRRRREVVEEWFEQPALDQCSPPFDSSLDEQADSNLSGPPTDHDFENE